MRNCTLFSNIYEKIIRFWLAAVQFKRNTSANCPSQWYHVKWWRNFCLVQSFLSIWEKKVFSNGEKGFKRDFRHFFQAIFFMFILLIRNGECNFSILKTLQVLVNSRVNEKKTVWLPTQTSLYTKITRYDFTYNQPASHHLSISLDCFNNSLAMTPVAHTWW